MKKTVFRMAAATVVAACMAACSGSDDLTSNGIPQEPTTPTAPGEVILTGTLGSKGDMTRSVASDGTASWTVGDEFAIYYPTASGHSTAVATVSSVNGDGSANFTAKLYYPAAGSVNLVYPASAHDGHGGFKTDALMTQNGTLAYINANGLDIHTATATLSVEETGAMLNSDVTMEPAVCLYNIDLRITKDESSIPLNTKNIEISDGTHNYTITTQLAKTYFNIALLPASNADFTITAVEEDEDRSTTNITYVKDFEPANIETTDVGNVITTDGKVYHVSTILGVMYSKTFESKTLVAGKWYNGYVTLDPYQPINTITPIAMIAYVGEPGTADTSTGAESYRGLAMAMQDVNNTAYIWGGNNSESVCTFRSSTFTNHYNRETRVCGDLNGIANTAKLVAGTGVGGCGHDDHEAAKAADGYNNSVARPAGCSNWFLPSSGQWILFYKACGVPNWNLSGWSVTESHQSDYDKVTTMMKNATASYKGSMYSSSERTSTQAVRTEFQTNNYDGSGVGLSNMYKTQSVYVRPFFAF